MEHCRLEKRDHVWYVTIERPEVMNALNPQANMELGSIWDDFAADESAWIGVITGAGEKAFCAGNDLKSYAERVRTPDEAAARTAHPLGVAGLSSRHDLFKPLIARVNGYALGGGLELAMACDIIVAADHARLGLPEPRVGRTPGAGGVHRLSRSMPFKAAMGYLLTGRQMTAARAFELGLVNEVVPMADLDRAVQSWVDDLMAAAPLSLRSIKQQALVGMGRPLDEALSASYEWEDRVRRSEDLIEGARAFAEKRPPQWRGR